MNATQSAAQAIILAAGRGSRLHALTETRPKCMLPLLGKPLLSWMQSTLVDAGIYEQYVVTGYCHQVIDDYVNHVMTSRVAQCDPRDEFITVTTIHNHTWENGGMLSSYLCAAELLRGQSTLICYGDIAIKASTLKKIAGHPGDIVVTSNREWHSLWSARFDNPLIDAESFSQTNGVLTKIGSPPKSIDDIKGQFMGVIKFTPDGWAWFESLIPKDISKQLALDTTKILSLLVSRGIAIHVIEVDGGWIEIDNARDLDVCHSMIEMSTKNLPCIHDWRDPT